MVLYTEKLVKLQRIQNSRANKNELVSMGYASMNKWAIWRENFVINFDEVFGDHASALCGAHGIEPQHQDLVNSSTLPKSTTCCSSGFSFPGLPQGSGLCLTVTIWWNSRYWVSSWFNFNFSTKTIAIILKTQWTCLLLDDLGFLCFTSSLLIQWVPVLYNCSW